MTFQNVSKTFGINHFFQGLFPVSPQRRSPAAARVHLYLELVVGLDLLPERRGQRQQAALVHLEPPVLVAADDVDGEGGAVPGRVPVRHHQLEDAAAHRLALLQETRAG